MRTRESLDRKEDKGAGALVGTFVGDALGMPVEGWSASRIEERHGEVDEMLDARMGRGTYTDDTQMMIATAKSLLAEGGVTPQHLAESYLDHYDSRRGYGRGTVTVFEKWRKGASVTTAAKEVYDGGSFGNGGSMRIAPVGVAYADDVDRLEEAVRTVCGLTHAHPLGIGSSFLQALSVAKAYRGQDEVDPRVWVRDLKGKLPSDLDEDGVLTSKLETLESHLERTSQPLVPGEVAREPGCSSRAYESVPGAIYAFLANVDSFRDALVYAVGIGGDTDTIGAMTGAIAGAYHGVSAVPDPWWEALENGPDGRDDILKYGVLLSKEYRSDQ